MEKMINKYLDMYEDMATSKDPKKMVIFGEMEKWAFKEMVAMSPQKAQQWLDKLEAHLYWNNFLSRSEAEEIVTALVNQDGTRGAHWSYDVFRSAVTALGGKMSDEPYYNCYALWAVANMLYSDHAKSASEYVPKEDMPKYFYMQALEKLKDRDRTHFVRDYFKV